VRRRGTEARRAPERGDASTGAPAGLPHIDGFGNLTVVGRGATATVYRATQEGFDRAVAIKVLNVDISDRRAQKRFQRERALNGRLSDHPNVVTVLDAGFVDGRYPYLAMELFEQGSLTDRLASHGPFDVALALHIGVRIAGALESAHRVGVLHRDVKPQNVLLSRYGEPALADFGIAALLEMEHSLTAALTPVHAAPEVLEGHEPTATADVYSLASTLHTTLSGVPPFAGPAGEGMLAQLLRITTGEPPRIARTDIPRSFVAAIDRALAKQPGDRFTTAAEFGAALQRVQREVGLPVTGLPVDADSTTAAAVVAPAPESPVEAHPEAVSAPAVAPAPAAPAPVEATDTASTDAPAAALPPPAFAPPPPVGDDDTIDVGAAIAAGAPPRPRAPEPTVTPVTPAPAAPAPVAPAPPFTPIVPAAAAVVATAPVIARPGAFDDERAELDVVVAGAPVDAPTMIGRQRQPALVEPEPARRRWVVPVTAAAALAVGAGAAVAATGVLGDGDTTSTTVVTPATGAPGSLPGDLSVFAPTGVKVAIDADAVLVTWRDGTQGAFEHVVGLYLPGADEPKQSLVEKGQTLAVFDAATQGVDVTQGMCFLVSSILGLDDNGRSIVANAVPECINGATAEIVDT
jgi:tRNA A-37 threonylcarbamoyl transferase component Bud32